jgi:hypothetical protein
VSALPPGIPADKVVYGGRTHGQLWEAFNLVKTAGNWKMPIDAVVKDDVDLQLVADAVAYFTGGPISTDRTSKGVRVRSEGYYHHIGA